MTLKSEIAADVDRVFTSVTDFGRNVRYYGDRGINYTPAPTIALLADGFEDVQTEGDENVHTEILLTISATAIPTDPAVNHELEVRGKLCRVLEWDPDDDGAIRLRCLVGGTDPGP